MKEIIKCEEVQDFTEVGGRLKILCEHLEMPKEVNIVIGRFRPGEGLKEHYHRDPTAEVYYISRGEGTVFVENERIQVHEKMALYVPPEKKHYIVNTGSQDLEAVFIEVPCQEDRKDNTVFTAE